MGEIRGKRAESVTSHDVAAAAGVSQTTVARVFSSPDKVATTTKQRVHDAASALGYVPNAIARSLKSQRTHIVGAVVPAHGEYWQSVLTAFSRRLAERGEQLLLFSFEDADHVDEALDSVEQYRLDGLVLASSTIGHEHLMRMRDSGQRVLAFNQPAATGLLHSVTVDNEMGMSDLAQHLLLQGIQSATFVGGVPAASTDQSRYRGATVALAEHGVACPYIEAGAYTYDAGYKVATQILESEQLPDAVMVASDEIAFGLHDGLRAGGVEAPTDVLLTGFDGLPQAAWAGYDLTTLVQPVSVLVEEALHLMLDEPAESPSARPAQPAKQKRVVPGTIREGRSTRRPHG